jgi:hypothetical protein
MLTLERAMRGRYEVHGISAERGEAAMDEGSRRCLRVPVRSVDQSALLRLDLRSLLELIEALLELGRLHGAALTLV